MPPTVQPQELPAGLTEDGTLQVQPEAILDVRFSAAGGVEVLVKWLHLLDCETHGSSS